MVSGIGKSGEVMVEDVLRFDDHRLRVFVGDEFLLLLAVEIRNRGGIVPVAREALVQHRGGDVLIAAVGVGHRRSRLKQAVIRGRHVAPRMSVEWHSENKLSGGLTWQSAAFKEPAPGMFCVTTMGLPGM